MMKAKNMMRMFTLTATCLLTGILLTACKSDKTAKTETIDEEAEDTMMTNLDAYFDDVETVTVKTARELILALKSDCHIIVKGDDALNMTDAIDELVEEGELEQFYDNGEPRSEPGVYFDPVYDGNSLVVNGLHDIYIEAKGDEDGILIVDPRYADVFFFNRCDNIVMKGLTMGHSDTGDCSGDVVRMNYCDEVIISKCSLYGCGVIGFDAECCSNIALRNSEFFGCSEDGIGLYKSWDVEVKGCKIFENGLGIYVDESDNVVFDDCRFFDNHGHLFRCYSPIMVKNSYIDHHFDDDTSNVELIDCEVNMDYSEAEEMPDIEDEEE